MHQRLLTCLSVSIAAAFGSGAASAVGFGRASPSASLGAPLDFSVPLRLETGEILPDECVAAQVVAGDAALANGVVYATLESAGPARSLRVRTSVRIDEPILAVTVTVGCDVKVSRKFTLFADPPGLSTGLPAVVAPPAVVADAPAALPVIAPSAMPARPAAARAGPARIDRAPTRKVVRTAPKGDDALVPRSGSPAQVVATEPGPAAASKSSAPRSSARLRLDAPSVTFAADQAAEAAWQQREELLAAVRAATTVAQVAADSASTRVAAMEASVEALKRDAKAQRDAVARLQQSLSEADDRGRWTPWLLGAVIALLGAAGWLYTRLRRAEKLKQSDWWQAPAASGADAPAAVETPPPNPDVGSVSPAAPVQPLPAAPVSVPTAAPVVTANVGGNAVAEDRSGGMTQHTQPLPAGFVVPDSPSRDVSIEELLDIEQQAEFFIVLGQDDAAVDLLMGHLRSTGGSSPLPYLKLMEIYHRRGDQTAYERIRVRFNDRFNAVAPDWSSDLNAGRSLESYPEIMSRIENDWSRPVDVMADLETLLFRTDGNELFDLPAYRDVLFLFTLARDVQESIQHEAPQVDVLLPLFRVGAVEVAEPEVTTPSQHGELRLTLVERPKAAPEPQLEVAAPAATDDALIDIGFLKDSGPEQRH